MSEWERQRRIQRDGSGSGRGSGSANWSVAAARGLEGAAREAVWWRVGESVAAGRQREQERERAVEVTEAGSVGKCRQTTSTSWAACCIPIECGGFEGDSGVVFPQSLVLLWRHKRQVTEQGDQNHSTSCLF